MPNGRALEIKNFFFTVVALIAAVCGSAQAQEDRFDLMEATIDDVHRAIQEGQTSCQTLVNAYIDRARAYNGTCNALVTEDMASQFLPDYNEYKAAVDATASLASGDPGKTLPIDFGRMEPTASDPSVQQQFGMLVGIPDAGQVRALSTLNIRGERSVTCKGEFDQHPSAGPLPAGAPEVCEEFRRHPDALELAAELDAQYGRSPDLARLPMYCIPFSFKDPFDTLDMRSTGGADARYDIDFPARDHTLVEQLRSKGAIIYAKANTTEYNGRGPGNPGGDNYEEKVLASRHGYMRSTWAGNPCNPYDTTRAASIGSSSGSGISVSTNLVMCSICEETNRSCRGPANHNAVATILPYKGQISFLGGGIGNSIYSDRSGITCRSVVDAAKVLDALKDPISGFYDPRDIFTTVPRSSTLSEPFARAITAGHAGALKGMRIGVVREFMIKNTLSNEPIVDAAAIEMKEILSNHLGAELVESVTPGWPDDPEIENMSMTFDRAVAEIAPVIAPNLLYELTASGEPVYPGFAAAIEPTEFAPGIIRGTGSMAPADWMLRWAEGLEPTPPSFNLRKILEGGGGVSRQFRFHIAQYLDRRARDWAEKGYTETLSDWAALNDRSKFWSDEQRADFLNWEQIRDLHQGPIGVAGMIAHREFMNRVFMKVIQDNKLDLLIHLHSTLPTERIGLAPEPSINDSVVSYTISAGLMHIIVPAGYVQVAYDATFYLHTDANGRKIYRSRTSTTPTEITPPGLPYSFNFVVEPGMESLALKAASAYEAASKRRIPPPAFGPLPVGNQ